MDDDGLNMRNWGYYEPTLKGHLGLQLMPTAADRNTRSFLSGRENAVMVTSNGAFHHRDCVVSDAPVAPMDYVRDSWMNPRDKYLNVMPGNHNYWNIPEPSGAHTFQMIHQPEAPREDRMVKVEDSSIKKEVGPLKKRGGADVPKVPKAKKPRKNSRMPKDNASASAPPRVKQAKKNFDVVINGINLDISGIPIPVCTCTGSPQQCYRWGCGGWQSACCTTSVSIYPLPMSTKRRGARIAGRKMSQGAFKKVLEKLAAEGYNFGNPIDLRSYWAKHGTNKFVTIR